MKNEEGTPSTVKSIEVVLAEGVEIPYNANLFFNFMIAENQPTAAGNFETNDSINKPFTLNTYAFNPETDVVIIENTTNDSDGSDTDKSDKPVKPTKKPKKDYTEENVAGCGSIILGNTSFVIVILAFILAKKR
jgi:hypothetical protein